MCAQPNYDSRAESVSQLRFCITGFADTGDIFADNAWRHADADSSAYAGAHAISDFRADYITHTEADGEPDTIADSRADAVADRKV